MEDPIWGWVNFRMQQKNVTIQHCLLQLFLAIAIPLEHPVYNIFLSYNIEANYNLPENQTEFTYPPIVSKRSLLQRRNLYEAIENKIEM